LKLAKLLFSKALQNTSAKETFLKINQRG